MKQGRRRKNRRACVILPSSLLTLQDLEDKEVMGLHMLVCSFFIFPASSPYPSSHFKIFRVRGWWNYTCSSVLSSLSLLHPRTPLPILTLQDLDGERDGEITHGRLLFIPLHCFISPDTPSPSHLHPPSPFKISPYLHLNNWIVEFNFQLWHYWLINDQWAGSLLLVFLVSSLLHFEFHDRNQVLFVSKITLNSKRICEDFYSFPQS